MIASVAGTVIGLTGEAAIVEVGGIGIAVQCTPATLATLRTGSETRLATSLVVREDSLTLFGFGSDDERAIFETLQGVTGVGPRLAQAVLATHSPDSIRAAVTTDDVGALTLVPGIGRKGAQRLVLELKDKLGTTATAATVIRLPGRDGPGAWREQLRSALLNLGWGNREVDEALAAVGPEAEAAIAVGDVPDVAALLKTCLQMLSRA
ncbi:MAG: Holliday junction branch migration protein RuvA [Frankiaceae bacterium]|nr:Holliday junction branch migration protein RuvA [Frankiaceae bacterium]MBV9871812.1 Holliday junction branch migration protein RuvA [Frankiaceae bacterium]